MCKTGTNKGVKQMLNKAILIGRLTNDPELRYTQNKTSVASFSIAVNRDKKGSNGEQVADFINCVVWGKQAEFIKQWFTKGMLAVVVGQIQSNNWKDKNGNSRTSIIIKVDEIKFGESKKARGINNTAPNIVADDFTELDDGDLPF